MAVRYSKLWKRLIDENMMKVDLRNRAGITTNALAKLGKNEHVSTATLLFDTKVKTFFKKILGQEPRLDPAVTPTLSIST